MITAKASIKNPGPIEVDITLTMSIAEWRKIYEALASFRDINNSAWPYWKVSAIVAKAIDTVCTSACEDTEVLE